jgi:NAD(P)-dependent dehydrogenase (short-subunit alcohol dehydrogenase family)
MGEFYNQVIMITGGGSGIGKACARLFGREQATVVVLDWNEKAAESTVSEIESAGGVGLAIKADVANSHQVKAAISKTIERFGRIDILFANAAIQVIQPIESTTDEQWDRVISANLKGTFVCCREVIPVMRRQRSGRHRILWACHPELCRIYSIRFQQRRPTRDDACHGDRLRDRWNPSKLHCARGY